MPNILQDPEQAVEVEEELALDDRKLPLAFNYPRHQDSICGMETESQVGLVVSACRCLTAIHFVIYLLPIFSLNLNTFFIFRVGACEKE